MYVRINKRMIYILLGGVEEPSRNRKEYRKNERRGTEKSKPKRHYMTTIDVTMHGELRPEYININGKKPFGYKSQKNRKREEMMMMIMSPETTMKGKRKRIRDNKV